MMKNNCITTVLLNFSVELSFGFPSSSDAALAYVKLIQHLAVSKGYKGQIGCIKLNIVCDCFHICICFILFLYFC